MFPYDKAIALCRLYPDSLFYAVVAGTAVTIKGSQMRGYLLPSDQIQEFKKFS